MRPKPLQILKRVLHDTGADKIWLGFLIVFFAAAAIIWLLEPDIDDYGKAVWYCYSVVTTIGFGDVIAQHFVSRILSALLSIAAAIVIALITGVIVNYYNQITDMKRKETLAALMDKLEHLPELSHEELVEISERAKEFQDK